MRRSELDLIGYACQSALHQPATGLLLAFLFLGCVRRDRLVQSIVLVILVIGAHSAIAIGLSASNPAAASMILPRSDEYWARTAHWIATGEDAEYQWRHWLPAHLLLFAFVLIRSYLSFGWVAFATGLEEVDLMNFYVGRLVDLSGDPVQAILFGWHPWSILRGVACTVIVFEIASLSLQRLSNQPLSPRGRRIRRLKIGFSFAVLDALVKILFAPTIRNLLLANLSPGTL